MLTFDVVPPTPTDIRLSINAKEQLRGCLVPADAAKAGETAAFIVATIMGGTEYWNQDMFGLTGSRLIDEVEQINSGATGVATAFGLGFRNAAQGFNIPETTEIKV